MRPQILIIDDSQTDRALITKTLRERFADSVVISEGERVESVTGILMSATVDIVLLDMNLPGLSGRDALQEVRRLEPSAAVIVLTGDVDSKLEIQSLVLGAVKFCSKSDLDELPQSVLSVWQSISRGRTADTVTTRRIDTIVTVLETTAQQQRKTDETVSKLSKVIYGPEDADGLLQIARKTEENFSEFHNRVILAAWSTVGLIATSMLGGFFTWFFQR